MVSDIAVTARTAPELLFLTGLELSLLSATERRSPREQMQSRHVVRARAIQAGRKPQLSRKHIVSLRECVAEFRHYGRMHVREDVGRGPLPRQAS